MTAYYTLGTFYAFSSKILETLKIVAFHAA